MRFPELATVAQIDLVRRDHRRALARGIRRGPRARRAITARCWTTPSAPRRHPLQAGLAVRREEARRGAGGAQHRRAHRDEVHVARQAETGGRWSTAGAAASARGAMAHILREIGWHAAQLEGGYKAYRREVVAQLETLPRALQLPRHLRRHRQRQEPPARALAAARRAGARSRATRGAPRLGARQPARASRSRRRRCSRACVLGRAARASTRDARCSSKPRARRSASCRCPRR